MCLKSEKEPPNGSYIARGLRSSGDRWAVGSSLVAPYRRRNFHAAATYSKMVSTSVEPQDYNGVFIHERRLVNERTMTGAGVAFDGSHGQVRCARCRHNPHSGSTAAGGGTRAYPIWDF